MTRIFNIAGPCNPKKHYMLPAQERCEGLDTLIGQGLYFVIYAARQSGKSTLLLDLSDQIEASGMYHAIYCSLEGIQDISDPKEGIPAIVRTIEDEVQMHERLSVYSFGKDAKYEDFTNVLRHELTVFCKKIDKPLVLLFDEVDCLSNGTLITFLRQLRYGYTNRNRGIPFLHSVALVGMRNIRDYKAKIRDYHETLGSASPFNIVTESLTLRNFSISEIGTLYGQYAKESGQNIHPDVIERVFFYTQGQPWLVNAMRPSNQL